MKKIKYCVSCLNECNDDAKFCQSCGEKTFANTQKEAELQWELNELIKQNQLEEQRKLEEQRLAAKKAAEEAEQRRREEEKRRIAGEEREERRLARQRMEERAAEILENAKAKRYEEMAREKWIELRYPEAADAYRKSRDRYNNWQMQMYRQGVW